MSKEELKELIEIENSIAMDSYRDPDELVNWVEKKKLEWERRAFKKGYISEQNNIIIRLGLDK